MSGAVAVSVGVAIDEAIAIRVHQPVVEERGRRGRKLDPGGCYELLELVQADSLDREELGRMYELALELSTGSAKAQITGCPIPFHPTSTPRPRH
jgi:hypothetical protein